MRNLSSSRRPRCTATFAMESYDSSWLRRPTRPLTWMPRCSSAQSAVMNSRTLYATTVIRNRMEFAGDQLFDEPPSAIMGLDLVEMTVDNSRRAASDF